MHYAYPIDLTPEADGSAVTAQAPDVPGVTTWGDGTAEALRNVADALVAGIEVWIGRGEPIPMPSVPRPGQVMVDLPPLVAAKLALYDAMRAQDISRSELARRIGVDESLVRRLLDLRHRSRLDQLERALDVVGLRIQMHIVAV
ncbi:type II toxin-antitoxin system HicB family antitoxin (plasmid) [Tistrella mobilis]|uniref:type II toxin-antitoxin system HicB family antitoxin n=1 Tax=Tistrella mobilis TaxID=171437 RepID=UPI0035588B71